jgi:hypothetical protein
MMVFGLTAIVVGFMLVTAVTKSVAAKNPTNASPADTIKRMELMLASRCEMRRVKP